MENMCKNYVIAIDGEAGTGKSSARQYTHRAAPAAEAPRWGRRWRG